MTDVLGTTVGPLGQAPYADNVEYVADPGVQFDQDFYRPFFATDARSVLITILPNHYNFIPNPSFRVDGSGWETSGNIGAVSTAYSWTFPSAGNLLRDEGSTFEADPHGWIPVSSTCTLELSTDFATEGVSSLKATSTVAGLTRAFQSSGVAPVVPGKTYTAVFDLRVPADRNASASISFYTLGGSGLGAIGATPIAGAPAGWQRYTATMTAPSSSSNVRTLVGITNAEIGDVFYVDRVGIWEGTSQEWLPPVEGYLNDITNGTANADITPDPGSNPAPVDGQLVYISGEDVWVIVDSAGTLSPGEGVAINRSISGFRIWRATEDSLVTDSWTGRAVRCSGSGTFRYRESADRFVYVGNVPGTSVEQYDPRRGGAEYTFSVYAKGRGSVRLRMDAYLAADIEDLSSGPEYQNLRLVPDPSALGGRNLLNMNQATGSDYGLTVPTTSDVPYFSTITGGTASSSTSYSDEGSRSIRVAPTGAGNVGPTFGSNAGSVVSVPVNQRIPASPGETITVAYSVISPSTVPRRDFFTLIFFFDALGNQLSSSGQNMGSTPTSWTRYTFSAVAPPETAYIGFRIYVGGVVDTTEYTYYDRIGLWKGEGGDWTYPGEDAVLDEATGRVWSRIDPVPTSAPYFEDIDRPPYIASTTGTWDEIEDDGQWHRVVLTTRARVPEGNGQISFMGARWIDAQIEVNGADGLLLSSVMLDSTEYPECAFFDGGITEDPVLDDFIWEGDANSSVSMYYYDRLVRAKWLCTRLPQVIPAGRPYQIFFGSYWRPFVCSTGETVMLEVPPSPQGP